VIFQETIILAFYIANSKEMATYFIAAIHYQG